MTAKIEGIVDNVEPDYDPLITQIVDYVYDYEIPSEEASQTALWCLLDSMGCALMSLSDPDCVRKLGPTVDETSTPLGARVPGTGYVLDPIKASFDISACIRWQDYNDTWLAAEWGHPSDNLGSILAVADFISRTKRAGGEPPLVLRDILHAMVKAYEIQGVLALENSFNRVGLDHVLLVKVASTAVVSHMLGASKSQCQSAVSHAWIDGSPLRTYRHAPNTGPRKSWAAGDAVSRAVMLAYHALRGEPGIHSALTAKDWGFQDVCFKGNEVKLAKPLGSYVMENILFKVAFPAEFHGQTAVEAAIQLHDEVADWISEIRKIEITTQEAGMRIINKVGPLHNHADRDHCLQYMVAVGLLCGELTATHYDDEVAADPLIDGLREKMVVKENPDFTQDYFDPDKRSIANSVQVFYGEGSKSQEITVHYPLGHRQRRQEALPLLKEKFNKAINLVLDDQDKIDALYELWTVPKRVLEELDADTFMELWLP